MEFQEFKYIYDDLRNQFKSFPKLNHLLKLTQKSIKKLQCMNLYAIVQKRQLDLEIEQEKINSQISSLYHNIQILTKQINNQKLLQIQQQIKNVKQKNMDIFDLLTRQDQLLTQQVQLAQYFIGDQDYGNQIKQVDEDQDIKQQQINKKDKLKQQIDDIQKKILKINFGKGKWIQSDHNDFIKIYNKSNGNDKKIIQQGTKFLGMKNTQIMDHLQVYQQYLQLEKQKKIVTYQYKQIKQMEKQQQYQKQQKQKIISYQTQKKIKQQKQLESQKKKIMIKTFKQKKQGQKQKIILENQQITKKKPSIPLDKKKQIIERNKKYILAKQENFKKTQGQSQGRIGSSLKK